MLEQYFPVLLQLIIATGFAVTTLLLSVMLGKSARSNSIKDSPYECGMLPLGESQPRFSVKFYLVAMLFVIFDIEVVFMYPWALTFRDFVGRGQGAMVFWSMSGFVGILLVAYLYALKKGALSWKS
jgi:NADH-quinone oxidoreductase subunit A